MVKPKQFNAQKNLIRFFRAVDEKLKGGSSPSDIFSKVSGAGKMGCTPIVFHPFLEPKRFLSFVSKDAPHPNLFQCDAPPVFSSAFVLDLTKRKLG